MKSNYWTLALCLAESSKKYFKVLMEAVGEQVSPTNSLFCRFPPTTIISFNLSLLPSDWIFFLYTSMHGVKVSLFFGSWTRKFWLLMRFLISFWFSFSQGFFYVIWQFDFFSKLSRFCNEMGNFWTRFSQRWYILKNLFTAVLNTLCKPFLMVFLYFNAP